MFISLGIKEYYRGLFLGEAQAGRRGEFAEAVRLGPHGLLGGYTDVTVAWMGIEIEVQTSAADDGGLVVLVDPKRNQKKSAVLSVGVGYDWGMPGVTRKEGDRLLACSDAGETPVFLTGTLARDPYIDVDVPHLLAELTGAVVISTGRRVGLAEARSLIAAARAEAESLDEARTMVRDAIAWNTLYEPMGERVVTQCSRLWNVQKRGGYALFCWDTFFSALMSGVFSRDLGYANALEMLGEAVPDGFVPNVAQGTGRVTYDGSQPPIGSLVCWQLYDRYGDEWFLRDALPTLLSWNRWWWRARRYGELISGGSTVFVPEEPSPQDVPRIGQHFGATCESGADDHPCFADIPYDDELGLLRAHDVGLSAEYALDCEMVARIAEELGADAVRAEVEERGRRVRAAIEDILWDDESGIFRDHFFDTLEPTASLSPMSFLPMLAGIGTPEQTEAMVTRYLRDPEWFGGEWVIPSSPNNDPRSARQSYWYGRVWPPLNFLVYTGLLRMGRDDEATWLAERSRAIGLKEWREHRHLHENYSSLTGEGCDVQNSEPFLTWGGLWGLLDLVERDEVGYFGEWRTRGRDSGRPHSAGVD